MKEAQLRNFSMNVEFRALGAVIEYFRGYLVATKKTYKISTENCQLCLLLKI